MGREGAVTERKAEVMERGGEGGKGKDIASLVKLPACAHEH